MKKFLTAVIIGLMLCSGISPSFAASLNQEVNIVDDKIKVIKPKQKQLTTNNSTMIFTIEAKPKQEGYIKVYQSENERLIYDYSFEIGALGRIAKEVKLNSGENKVVVGAKDSDEKIVKIISYNKFDEKQQQNLEKDIKRIPEKKISDILIVN